MKKLTTRAACEIAQIEQQRLNEDIAKGHYTCAPEAQSTVGRFWDEADICGLSVYAFLLRVYGAGEDAGNMCGTRKPGLTKALANQYACIIAKAI